MEVFYAGGKGFGVKTTKDIEEDQFVIEYVGEVIQEKYLIEKLETEYLNSVHHYAMNLENKFVIDAYKKGNLSRFMNHSCDTNLKVDKWVVHGTTRISFYAKRFIRKGEELTINYKFERYNKNQHQKCLCGAN